MRSSELTDRSSLGPLLSFEAASTGDAPGGWGGGPAGTIFADNSVVHGGRGAARIERTASSKGTFSSLTVTIPIDFAGSSIELRGYLRTEEVSDFAGFWMREDGEIPGLVFDNMQGRQIKGTTPWTEYSIKLPVHTEARQISFGALLVGTGKAWVDDLQLVVDGKPIAELPRVAAAKTALEQDHQFDQGSGISAQKLTNVQIENLVTLGRVWGFLKYHHLKVTSGQLHWDYELFRIMPEILRASSREAANAALARWIDGLGPIARCQPCAKLEGDVQLRPDLGWIADQRFLGAELSRKLTWILENRATGAQFYVGQAPEIGNPVFKHEPAYEAMSSPDTGFRLLAAFRFWNAVEYWSPDRNLIEEDWPRVLMEFVPRMVAATGSDAYKRELMALIARLHDGHANLWSSLDARPPVGDCGLPINVRFVERAPTITAIFANTPPDLKVGDVLTELDGVPLSKLLATWAPFYGASNDAARLHAIGLVLTRGPCGATQIAVRRDAQEIKLNASRVPAKEAGAGGFFHDQPGPTFRLLSKDVAYLKLSSVKSADAAHYVEQAAGTKGLIIDIRNYPSEFMVFALGSLLVEQKTDFARFTQCDLANPGAFRWSNTVLLEPAKPHYGGKIMILVDESSISQAEYTAMAFRAAHGVVVGSMTAGADGNVSRLALPGGLDTMISGLGVFYPDKSPTQRVGIKPDVEVRPTRAGIRAGRDEVLEEAIRQILGREVSADEIQKMARGGE